MKTRLQSSGLVAPVAYNPSFIERINLTSREGVVAAIELVSQLSHAWADNGHAKCALSQLLEHMAVVFADLQPYENLDVLRSLLDFFRAKRSVDKMAHEDELRLLKACFNLVTREGCFFKALGFHAVVVAASYRMPVHQSLKGIAEDKSLLALFMETSLVFDWGPHLTREMMLVIEDVRNIQSLQVQINADDVEFKKAEEVNPERWQSYVSIPDFSAEEKIKNQQNRLQLEVAENCDQVMLLEKLAETFSVPYVVSAWHQTSWNALHTAGMRRNFNYVTPLQQGAEAYFTENPNGAAFSELVLSPDALNASHNKNIKKVMEKYYENNAWDNFIAYPGRVFAQGYYIGVDYDSRPTVRHTNDRKPISLSKEDETQVAAIYNAYVENRKNPAYLVPISSYYHTFLQLPVTKPIYKNLLLFYLANGSSAQDESYPPHQCFTFTKTFKKMRGYHPRLVEAKAGSRKISSVYLCESGGEVAGFLGDNLVDVIHQSRVCDFKVLRHLKAIGCDFSLPEVTAFIADLVEKSEFSIGFYHLLECLLHCGAVLPKEIGRHNFADYFLGKLEEQRDAIIASCNRMQKTLTSEAEGNLGYDRTMGKAASVSHYLRKFGLKHVPEAGEDLIVYLNSDHFIHDYFWAFDNNVRFIRQQGFNYPSFLLDLSQTLRWKGPDKRMATVNAALLCKSLAAYLSRENYYHLDVSSEQNYFDFFFSVVKIKHQWLADRLIQAMKQPSENHKKVSNYLALKKRRLMVRSFYNEITHNISEILLSSAKTPEDRAHIMKDIVVFDESIRAALSSKEDVIKSKKIKVCLEDYISGKMFQGECDLPRDECEQLGLVLPEEVRMLLFEFLGGRVGAVERQSLVQAALVGASAPEVEYKPELDPALPPPLDLTAPFLFFAAPSAPPAEEETFVNCKAAYQEESKNLKPPH